MGRFLRIVLWILGAFLVLVIGLYAYLRSADLTVYEDQIEAYASRAIGHDLDIGGRFELQFGGRTRIVAENVSLKNPNWSSEPDLLRVGHVTVVVDTWSLIGGPFVVEELEARDIEGRVELLADRRANWDTGREVNDDSEDFDTDRIAFRNVAIDGVELSYIDPERPRPIDVAIDTLTIAPDANDILDLDLQGTINELPLWADGKLGPWQNFLDGRDITTDLDLTLGTVRLSIDGSAEDLPYLQGIIANAVLTGPDIGRVIDRLGLPPFAEGPFEINADINRIDGGHQVSADGNLGAIDVVANGSIDRFIATESAELDFSVAGPNIQYLAELFGADGAPAAPFRMAGELILDGVRVGLSDTRLSIGSNSVGVNGELDLSLSVPDLDLTVEAEGPDFSVFGPFLELQGLPESAFAIEGNVRKERASWQANGVEAVIGENRITANGSLVAGSREDSAISFRALGPDISILHDFTDLEGLPARPFDVTASLRSHPRGIAIEQATGLFGDNRLEVDGIVTDRAGLRGTTLQILAAGPELANVALLTGVPHLPAGPFDVAGEIRLEEESLFFDDARATVGDLSASASGQVGLAGQEGAFRVLFTLNGPDAAQFEALPWLEPFSGQAFTTAGAIERVDNDLKLADVQLAVGEFRLTADGALSLSPMSNDSDFVFSVTGPSLRTIGQMFDSDLLVDKSFAFSGKVAGTPSGFAMRDFVAEIGESNIAGELTADLRDKPRVAARLSSTHLDLRERLQALAEREDEPEKEPAEEGRLLFSDEPIDRAMLEAADIDLELHVARLRTNTLDVTDFELGVRLLDGDLRIDPLAMTERAGTLIGRLHFWPDEGGYLLDTAIEADKLHIGLPPEEGQQHPALPTISGTAQLRGNGVSLHRIMASADGGIALRQGSGQVKEFLAAMLFKDVVLEALRTINPLRKKETMRALDCGIYEISIVDGIATLDHVAMQTDQLLLVATGEIDLETEKLNVNFRAKPREGLGVSLGTIANSFLGVRGTLGAPKVTLDPKGSATAAGAAVATGGISLLARGLWDRLSASKDICEQAPAQ